MFVNSGTGFSDRHFTGVGHGCLGTTNVYFCHDVWYASFHYECGGCFVKDFLRCGCASSNLYGKSNLTRYTGFSPTSILFSLVGIGSDRDGCPDMPVCVSSALPSLYVQNWLASSSHSY